MTDLSPFTTTFFERSSNRYIFGVTTEDVIVTQISFLPSPEETTPENEIVPPKILSPAAHS